MSNKLRYLRPVASYSSPLCLRLAIYHFKSEFHLHFQQLSIPLRATAFKFATSNSFRFCYVRQLSSSLRTTAFKLFFQCMNHSLIISVLTQDRLFCLYASLFVLFISSRSLTMHIQFILPMIFNSPLIRIVVRHLINALTLIQVVLRHITELYLGLQIHTCD